MNIENDTIRMLIDALMVVIPLGAGARVAHCALSGILDEDRTAELKRRGKTAICFTIFAECAMAIVGFAYHYYSG